MPERLIELPRVQLRGTWRDAALTGEARLRLDAESLQLAAESRVALRIDLGTFTGSEWRLGILTLYGTHSDHVLELSGDPLLGEVWGLLGEFACVLPELTRTMRSLGSRRGGSRVMQERFFAPLMQARRRLEIDARLEWRLAAFEAPVLRARIEETLNAFAVEIYPASAPDRRALEAELQERAEQLMARFERLHHAASEVHASPDSRRYAAWRRWTRAAADVFEEADRCWLACQPVVNEVARR